MSAAAQPRPGSATDAALAAPLGEWMRSVGVWLGRALECRALRLVWLPRRIEAACWTDDPAALDASTIDGETAEQGEGGGWLLPLEHGSSGMLCLYCASNASEARRAAMDDTLARAAQAVAASWSLAAPSAQQDLQLGVIDRQAARRTVHELRNALNSLLMNAATLTWRIDALPEPLQRFATQLQRDGERCSETLQRFEQLLDGAARDGKDERSH